MFPYRWHPTPVLLPGKSHGRGSLVGCSPRGHGESDMTEQLHFHFSLSCIGEGNGNPLQCSCLENPRDGGALWAAVYGVEQRWTRLKWLSCSIHAKINAFLSLMFFECWVLSQPFHSPLSFSSRASSLSAMLLLLLLLSRFSRVRLCATP